MNFSVRQTLKLTGGVLCATYFVMAVYIDETFGLLILSVITLFLLATVFALWRKRCQLWQWYCRRSLPIRGAIAGVLAWCLCFAWAFASYDTSIPVPDRIRHAVAVMTVFCELLAWPIARGGWFVLRDYYPPQPTTPANFALNTICGITLTAVLGAILFVAIHRIKAIRLTRAQWSLRSLLVLIAVMSLGLALYVGYFDRARIEGDVEFAACACGMTRAAIMNGKIILTEPNHETPAGTAVATIQVDGDVCTVTRLDFEGHVYTLSIDHLGAKNPEYANYTIQEDSWKLYPAHVIRQFQSIW